jgi:hypothetical protein
MKKKAVIENLIVKEALQNRSQFFYLLDVTGVQKRRACEE